MQTMSSSIPTDVLKALQNRELTPYKKLVAYTMLVSGLPASPTHEAACESNMTIGKTIKRLIENGVLTVTGMNENHIVEFKINSSKKITF